MAKGIVISRAEVQYKGIERTLTLDLSPENVIGFLEIQRRTGAQDQKWVGAQQERAGNLQDHEVATPKDPLTGFGVGVIPYFNGGYLLGGKRKEKGMKVTAIQGYPDSFKEMLHPLVGALRELYEEVAFRSEDTLYVPTVTGLHSLDTLVDEEKVRQDFRKLFRKRERLYRKWGVVDSREKGALTYTFQESTSPVLPLDTIKLYDSEQDGCFESKGFFYWDPTTSRANILYPLHIETKGIPFSSENAFGTEEFDRDSCLVVVPQNTLLPLDQPKLLNLEVCRTYSHGEESISTIPGAFNRGLASRAREKFEKAH